MQSVSILVVTGTGTDVGKTVVTAGIAALARARSAAVAVVKPAQTGVAAAEPGDLDEVRRLSGLLDLHEYARYPDPLSPAAAARRSHLPALQLDDVVRRIRELAMDHQLVIVEGAGGLLVRYDEDGLTLADIAHRVVAPVLVVTRAGLGTLNDTALTLEVMAHRGLDLAGVVIGAWPSTPDLAARANIRDLETLAARPLAGAFPAGAAYLDSRGFLMLAAASLGPAFGGGFDAGSFRRTHSPEVSA
ncbi:MAG: dethiobiotin synthase [Frankiales bacterium]|nr:dethiobiotin synthase [Frankiales bacterium]